MGVFINIRVNTDVLTVEQAAMIAPVCPVDIFHISEAALMVRPEQEDECVLCELCLDIAPTGAITIHKTYRDEVLVSRARPDDQE